MRRSLGWALGASLLASVAAFWSAETPRLVSAIEPQMREHRSSLEPVGTASSPAVRLPTARPGELSRLSVEPAKRNVFAAVEAPAPKPAPSSVTAIPTPPPTLPRAPSLNLRFLGRMLTPSGQRVLYLARGDTAMAVAVGDRTDEGYVVESLTSEGVTLVYPPLDVRVTVPIPPDAQQ